jgi:hypothetical protein
MARTNSIELDFNLGGMKNHRKYFDFSDPHRQQRKQAHRRTEFLLDNTLIIAVRSITLLEE